MENKKGKKSHKVGYDKSKNNKKKTTQARNNNFNKNNKKANKDINKVKLNDNQNEVNNNYDDYDKFNFIENTSVLNLGNVITEDDITEDYGNVPVMVSIDEKTEDNSVDPLFAEEIATEDYLPDNDSENKEEEITNESVVVEMNNKY